MRFKGLIACACLCAAAVLLGGCKASQDMRYGVFVGLDAENSERLEGYETVVIDGQSFSAEEIAALHKNGQTVYSYINIGSIERFRDYYDRFEPYALDVYENWEDERWIDVSSDVWCSYILDECMPSLLEKNIDGFFVDNADVYDVYPQEKFYSGVYQLVSGIAQTGKDVLINGGGRFIQEAISRGELKNSGITGINQECVFTSIDFENDTFCEQTEEERNAYLDYLSLCQENGLMVYLTEYAAPNAEIRGKISCECKKRSYVCYVSDALELN